jgi:hypothetical protein
MGSFQSFSEAFRLHHALQLAISRAFRAGTPICPETLTATFMAQFPDSGMSDADVRKAVVEEANAAGVTIRPAAKLRPLTFPSLGPGDPPALES